MVAAQPALFPAEQLLGPRGPEEVARVRSLAMECSSCALSETRMQVVFGVGNTLRPRVAFVGEGPGANEDVEGVPFVGRSGQLLDKMIGAMHLKRKDVYICNVVCCRPPENRRPKPEEIFACRGYLFAQLRAVQPEVIVALGITATEVLLNKTKKAKNLREKWHEWEGIPLRATFHPSYLLREPSQKKAAWDDLKAVMTKLKIEG